MDHSIRWLLDLAATVAFLCWQRSREWPELRLVPGSAAPRPARRVPRIDTGVIAVLVSRPEMEARVRWALSWRTTLRFASTWTELEQLVTRTSPFAVFADPTADESGDPEGHVARFCREGRVRVILYTALTPHTVKRLLGFGRDGVRHVIFHQFDDGAERLNAVVDWRGGPPQDPPPLQAA